MGNLTAPRVGIVGLGSIGRRHAAELHRAGAEVIALRRAAVGCASSGEASGIQEVTDADAFWRAALDAIVIANPTSLHEESLRAALEHTDAVVLVEKPVAATAAGAQSIPDGLRERVRVGYCLRFHPVVRAVRAAVEAGEIGEVLSGVVRFGSSLERWHPGTDYRRSSAARRELGGGVLRTLSHEIDLVQYWCGRVAAVSGLIGQVSALDLDVEDIARLSLRARGGALVAVDIDFFTPGYDRTGFLIGTAGRLDYSLNPEECTVRVARSEGGERRARFGGADEMYAAQTEDLLGWARGQQSRGCTYDEAVHVLEIIEAAEQGAEVRIRW